MASDVLIQIRRAKTDAKVSQKTEIISAVLEGPTMLADALDDLKAAGRITSLTFIGAPGEIVLRDIELAEAPPAESAS